MALIFSIGFLFASVILTEENLWQTTIIFVISTALIITVVVYKVTWHYFTKDENKKLAIKINKEISKLKKYYENLEEVIEKKTLELYTIEDEIIEKSKEYTIQNIYNRKSFYKISNVMISIAKRENFPLSLVFINISNLQDINESYGRNIGNELLKIFISLLEFYSRHSDIIARFSGGEFAILLPYTTKEGANIFAEKLQHISQKQSMLVENERINLSIDIMVEVVDATKDTLIVEVLERVEDAYFISKKP